MEMLSVFLEDHLFFHTFLSLMAHQRLMTIFHLSYTSLESNKVTEVAVCSRRVLVLAGKTNQTEPKKKTATSLDE